MDDIRWVRANSLDKNLFNVRFYLTNLRWLGVINNGEIVEVDGTDGLDIVDRVDKGRADGKKEDGLGIPAEYLVMEDPGIALENLAQ